MRPFREAYLEKIDFSTNPDFNADEGEFEMQNSFNIQIKKSKNEKRANVALLLETNMGAGNAPFQLRVKMASDFKWEDLDDETVEAMLKYNAPALLLGYMRPIVANITNASNFPSYNLPFINFKE